MRRRAHHFHLHAATRTVAAVQPLVRMPSSSSSSAGHGRASTRRLLALASLILAAVCLFWFVRSLRNLPGPAEQAGIRAVAYEATVARALDLALESTENLRQFTLLLLGALWALLLAKRDELHIGLGDYPEQLMFGCAHVLLGLSLYAQWRHGALIQEFLMAGERFGQNIPDFRDPRVTALVSLQVRTLCLGAVVAVAALFSVARLKP